MATRTITGVITRSDGTPWRGALVQFRLKANAYTASPQQTLPVETVEVTSDASGEVVVDLVSGLDKNYEVTLPDQSRFEITVPDGSAVDLETLRAATFGAPEQADNVETALLALYGTPPIGRAALSVQEGDAGTISDVVTLDFDASDFTISESPTGEVNVGLAYGTGSGTPAEGNHNHAATYAALVHTHTQEEVGYYELTQLANYTGTSNTTAAQKVFNQTTNGAITLPIGSYNIDFNYHIECADTDSSYLNILFAASGGAVVSWFEYDIFSWWSTADNINSVGSFAAHINTNAAQFVSSAQSTAKHISVVGNGAFVLSTGGVITPQYSWNDANQASPVTKRGSRIRITPTDGAIGTVWS